MTLFFRRRLLRTAGVAGLMVLPNWARAQSVAYPSKPVKWIVPYAAGGLPDTVARIVAQKLSERLGQSVVIENKPGGNGVVAYNSLLASGNDGHTFIVTDGSMMSITPQINKSAKFDLNKDILPVALIARSPLFLAVNNKVAASSFAEFVAQVRAKPGEMTYGSSGIGSTHHLTMEALKSALNLNIRHVPYRGSGQSVPALVGGQVDALFSAMPSLSGFAKSGQVKILASNDGQRSAVHKEVPTIAETIPGFDFSVQIGVLAAPGTAANVIQRIAQEIALICKMPDVVQTFQNAGIEPVGAGSADYAKEIIRENELMLRAGRAADLKPE